MSKRRRRNAGRGLTPGLRRQKGGIRKKTRTVPTEKTYRRSDAAARRLGVCLSRGRYDVRGLLRDPNKQTAETEVGSEDVSRATPTPRAPSKLRVRQSEIIERLIEKYDDGVERMARDTKLNPFQLSPGQLKKHIASFRHWGPRKDGLESDQNLKKLRWYNDPLKPKQRRFLDHR